MVRTPEHLRRNYSHRHLGRSGRTLSKTDTWRTVYHDEKVSLWAWPSRGGLIVLQQVTAPDFTFLGLDPVRPPLLRNEDQEAEDLFCQQLLRLGAHWFDSLERYSYVTATLAREEAALAVGGDGFRHNLTWMETICDLIGWRSVPDASMTEPAPTPAERCWVRVGWPSGADGGCWVAEDDIRSRHLMRKPISYLPLHGAKLSLARTMDEKCEILRDVQAGWTVTYYQSIEDYQGVTFLNAWGRKNSGEVGLLVKYPRTVATSL